MLIIIGLIHIYELSIPAFSNWYHLAMGPTPHHSINKVLFTSFLQLTAIRENGTKYSALWNEANNFLPFFPLSLILGNNTD